MKREDITKIFEGATDEQVSALLDIHSKDIGKAKGDTDGLKGQIEDLRGKLEAAGTTIKDLEAAKASMGDVDALRKTIDQQKAQIAGYENVAAVSAAGIDPRFHKFVASEVAASVTESKDFATALKEYAEANPQYAAQQPPANAWGKPQTPNPGDKPTKTMADAIAETMFPKKE
jgi:capsule polysaccharide export protein KpsE/RkpR